MISFADLFCGAGGATSGVLLAAHRKKIPIKYGVAINHWPVAVETHSANHPKVRHFCESIERVDPCEAVPSGNLDLLWASPECTHHSRARGGKPRQNQSRAGASHILTWLDKLYVRNLIIENVPEFEDWGPLDCHGQPMKSKKGESFRAFIESIKARNYNVEYRVLNAADYGDATTRRRLFIIARRKPLKIIWPEPTHRPSEELADELFGKKKQWKPARDIIDWSDLGTPLSQRKRPLRPNTMRRIFAGLEKFCGLSFILPTNDFNESRTASPDEPLETVTTKAHPAVVQPFIVGAGGRNYKDTPKSTEQPLGTILGKDAKALVQPFLIGQQSCAAARSTKEPIPTVATDGAIGLVQPFITNLCHSKGNGHHSPVTKPVPTVTTAKGGEFALVSSFVLPHEGRHKGNKARSIEQPLPTATASHGAGFLVSVAHGKEKGEDDSRRAISADKPLPTQNCSNTHGVAQAFIVSTKHGKDKKRSQSTKDPLPALTTKGEHALVSLPEYLVDFRGTAAEQLDSAAKSPEKDKLGLCRPFIVRLRGTSDAQVNGSPESADVPLSTLSAGGQHHVLVNPFITKYFGTGTAVSVDDPLDSVTTKDRFLLVNPKTNEAHELEIYFRLLKPSELSLAHSFPREYKFIGNKTQIVKQIGNSNPVELTAALTAAVL